LNQASQLRPLTRVAVGVLVRSDGAVLLADRPAGKPYAGHWEFPGGKMEDGESVEQALARELREELDLRIGRSDPWVVMEYDYPHAYVQLHFRRITDWTGTPNPVEGQRLQFLAPGDEAPKPLLPAAVPALRWVRLPTVSGHSPGTATDAVAAQAWLENALARGLRQILWHEPDLDDAQLVVALPRCLEQARAYGARLLVDARSAKRLGAGADALAAIFLGAVQLREAGARPPADCVGAGVQNRVDLKKAASMGCDFAVWEASGDEVPQGLAEQCGDSPLPQYVARRLSAAVLDQVRRAGAHGLVLSALP
jgi:8-oxo-dGTP diphosphatase